MRYVIKLIAVLLIFIAPYAQAEELAGEVTAAMGEAQITASAGGQRAAARGMPLYVGDILQTGTGGHIHIRMVDDALVSLRPNSKIKIVSYTYQPGVTVKTQIRLDLMHGTVRSVTGKGGELAKDRFRMNTPVAAIGVRGTDFIAQADAENTRVHVAMGAIVLAPLGTGCQENTLGACQTAAARVLTDEARNMMLELTRGMAEPRLVPLSDKLQIVAPQATGSLTRQPLQAQAPAESSGQVAVDANWQKNTLDTLTVQQTPSVTVPAVPLHYQMVWGRWLWTPQGSGMDMSYAEALQGREVTVGNGMGGLFRESNNPILLPQNGRTEFTLRQGQVLLPRPTGAIAGQVQGGTLGVDFNVNRFNTQLNISHPSLAGAVALNATGTLESSGIFRSTASGSNGFVAGSLSRDGAEAGYLFNLPTAAGTLNGTTLWAK